MGVRLITKGRRIRPLSLDRQAALVRVHYPGFTSGLHEGQLIIQGEIRPTTMSDKYRLRIEYAWSRPPRVYVDSPVLLTNGKGEEPPHRHSDADRPLCLFYGKNREWSPYEPLSTTTIPWTSEWLFFYETWLATGEWLGGGVEHAPTAIPVEQEPCCE